MEKTVILCDRCGKSDARKHSFAVDSESDGNGGSDTIHERLDLCADCEHAQLANFIAALTWPARLKMVDECRKHKRLYLAHMNVGMSAV